MLKTSAKSWSGDSLRPIRGTSGRFKRHNSRSFSRKSRKTRSRVFSAPGVQALSEVADKLRTELKALRGAQVVDAPTLLGVDPELYARADAGVTGCSAGGRE